MSMSGLLIKVIVSWLLIQVVSRDVVAMSNHWLYQKLDHFSLDSQSTFIQAYNVSGAYYRNKKPLVFVRLQSGFLWDDSAMPVLNYAAQIRAMYVELETRFKGKSRPTDNMRTEALALLTPDQILADLVYFVETFQSEWYMPENTKYILFGSSFSGSLALWARRQYPHVFHGAVASSPMLEANYNFHGFTKVIEKAIGYHDKVCLQQTKLANEKIEEWLLDPNEGHRQLYMKFLPCQKLKNTRQELSRFVELLSERVHKMVTFESTYPIELIMEKPIIKLKKFCDYMTGRDKETKNKSPVERYSHYHSEITKYQDPFDECLYSNYSRRIEELQTVKWSDLELYGHKNSRYWLYMSCTQLGLFPISNNRTHLFGSHLTPEYYQQLCSDVFGRRFNKHYTTTAISRLNKIFGGLKYNVRNTIVTQGLLDPWHHSGIVRKQNPQQTTFISMNGTSHAVDLYYLPETPPTDVKYARIKTVNTIRSWM